MSNPKYEISYTGTGIKCPPQLLFDEWDFKTKKWFCNQNSGERKPKAGAPCIIYSGSPHCYAIVFYRNPKSNEIMKIESMSYQEAWDIQSAYELSIHAVSAAGN